MRIAQEFVRDNPHIVAWYFDKRFELFKKHVIIPKFNVIDSWDRYEWQGRGSTHNHGLYYCSGAPDPDVELIANRTDITVNRLAQYWGHYITADHPEVNPQQLPEEGSGLSLAYTDMKFDFAELSAILSRCYMHKCMAVYCLQKDKTTGKEVCRFQAPWDTRTHPTFEKPPLKSYERFLACRNHMRVNAYNPTITLGWRANTDIQVCTSTAGVVQYMGVYASKGETQNASYKELALQVLPRVNSNNPMLSFASKLMNKLIGERDYSAQEVLHTLFGLPLRHSTRTVIKVDCQPEEAQSTTFTFRTVGRSAYHDDGEDTGFQSGQTVLQKYKSRPNTIDTISYIDYLLHFEHIGKRPKRRPRARPRILNYIPRYSPVGEPEEFARVKLMLHHPFREVSDTCNISGLTFETFAAAYEHCQHNCSHELLDSYGDPDLGVDPDDPNLEPLAEAQESSLDELAARRPGFQGDAVDEDALGDRPIDRVHDWDGDSHTDTFHLNPATYWDDMKRDHPVQPNTRRNTQPSTRPNTLQPNQALFYDILINHYDAYLQGRQPPQLLLNVDGAGGTGKTFVIEAVSRAMDQLAAADDKPSPILRCAPTGVAAYLIAGKTINSAFRIPLSPKGGHLEPLSAAGKQQLQATFKHIRYIIVDEKSMVSLPMLSWIHTRCGEAFPLKAQLPFAGLSVVLSGDFCQLPPVGRKGLYYTSRSRMVSETHGQTLYRKFTHTIELNAVMRQQGNDQASFRDALGRLRVGNSTQRDWDLLMGRCRVSLQQDERGTFGDAVRLCSVRRDVNTINHQCLRDFAAPVLAIAAKHDNPDWAQVPSNDAGNLSNSLPVCIGASVMLLHNIWTERGLVNGSSGVVVNVIWDDGVVNRRSKPLKAILVAIPSYTGPGLYTQDDKQIVIPIFPISRDFYLNRVHCARVQFPMCLAWAITIHKSQGMSLDKVVIQLSGQRDFVPGLLYVAVSRVKTLGGLMFEEPISFNRMKGSESDTTRHRQADSDRRKAQFVSVAGTLFH
jgi:ATP-dependent DNA helicase PIF1